MIEDFGARTGYGGRTTNAVIDQTEGTPYLLELCGADTCYYLVLFPEDFTLKFSEDGLLRIAIAVTDDPTGVGTEWILVIGNGLNFASVLRS